MGVGRVSIVHSPKRHAASSHLSFNSCQQSSDRPSLCRPFLSRDCLPTVATLNRRSHCPSFHDAHLSFSALASTAALSPHHQSDTWPREVRRDASYILPSSRAVRPSLLHTHLSSIFLFHPSSFAIAALRLLDSWPLVVHFARLQQL
jgi:hypothetical protein